MEQQNTRYDGFGHTLSGGPSPRLSMKNDSETIRHGAGTIFRQRTGCISTDAGSLLYCGALSTIVVKGEAIPAAPLRPLHAYLSWAGARISTCIFVSSRRPRKTARGAK